MILFDLNDGSFSNALEKALVDSRNRGPGHIFGALSTINETENLLEAVQAELFFPGRNRVEKLKKELTDQYLEQADGFFQDLWNDSGKQGMGQAQGLRMRMTALRVLLLAHDMAPPDSTTFNQFMALFEAYAARLAHFGDDPVDMVLLARRLWEKNDRQGAVEVLAAALVFHKAEGSPEEKTEECLELIDRYSRQAAQDLMDQAQGETDPAKAEHLAVLAIKTASIGRDLDPRMVPRLWGMTYRALERKLSLVKRKAKDNPSRHVVAQNLSYLERNFWFMPAAMETGFRAVGANLARKGVENVMAEAAEKTVLAEKIKALNRGVEDTYGFLDPEDPLLEKLDRLKELKKGLDALYRKAVRQSKAHLHADVAEQKKKAAALMKKAGRDLKETIDSPRMEQLDKLIRQGEETIWAAQEKFLKAKEAGPTPLGWRLAAESLAAHPRFTEALDWIGEIQQGMALGGNVLEIAMGDHRIIWFVKDALAMARGGGDYPLTLQMASVMPKRVEFYWRKGRAALVDHGTANGVFLKKSKRGKGDTQIMGHFYGRIPAGTPRTLYKSGEILMGTVCRLTWQVMGKSLILKFPDPWPPEEVIPDGEDIGRIWPGYQKETNTTLILSKEGFILGENPEGRLGPVPKGGRVAFRRAGEGFTMHARDQSMEVWGVKVKKAPVMRGADVRLGDRTLEFFTP